MNLPWASGQSDPGSRQAGPPQDPPPRHGVHRQVFQEFALQGPALSASA